MIIVTLGEGGGGALDPRGGGAPRGNIGPFCLIIVTLGEGGALGETLDHYV